MLIHSAWHPAVEWEGVLAGKPFSNQDFIDAFKAKFGKDPDEDNAIPFATCQGMAQAIAATNSTDNTVLRDWLAARTADDPVKTILGDFHWDEKGLPIDKAFLITQWQDGELKFVYPVGQFPGTSDLVWPKPYWSRLHERRARLTGLARCERLDARRSPALSLLEIRDVSKSFGGSQGGRRLLVRGRGRHDHRADRAERRRQDHHVQHDQRPAPGRFRRDPLRGPKASSGCSRTASPARASAAPSRSAAS